MHLGLILMAATDSTDIENLVQRFSAFGFALTIVPDGETALSTSRSLKPDLIFLDVTLPDLSGFDTCVRLKEEEATKNIPVIFVTPPSDTVSTVKGFSVGAVDYVTRPFQIDEVIARITTHLKIRNLQVLLEEIIANLQSEVAERKRAEEALQDSMKIVQQTNQRMKKDLAAAARVQQALLPEVLPALPDVGLAWTYRPSSELGGDSLNVFQLDANHVGLYVLDVSGHGVPASLLSVTLSRVLIPRRDSSCLLIKYNRAPETESLVSPGEIATRLNRMFPMNEENGQYFTFIYGILNIQNGIFRYTCAGHPPPLYLAPNGQVSASEIGNVPIGLFKDSHYDEGTIQMEPGGRIFLYSDGVLEAKNATKDFFGDLQLEQMLESTQALSLQASVNTIAESVLKWTGENHTQDDVSILAFEWSPTLPQQSLGTKENRVFEHQFPARASELGSTRQLARIALNTDGWKADIIEDIVLAIDEACQNIIRHAYQGECDAPITVFIDFIHPALVIMLEDQAPAVSSDCMNPRALDDIRPGGLGCHFMREVMDSIALTPSPTGTGNQLRMIKRVE